VKDPVHDAPRDPEGPAGSGAFGRSAGQAIRRAAAALAAAAIAATVGATAAIATTDQPVDLELLLAVDASPSVNYQEFGLQMFGLAAAFRDPAVVRAIRAAAPNGIAVALMQWAGVDEQALGPDWSLVNDAATADRFAARIEETPRLAGRGGTAVGNALGYGLGLLDANDFTGARRVIDLSGDGPANQGTAPEPVRARVVAAGVTVNGLAILDEEPDLARYYLANVVGGPGSFLLTADDFEDFARAIRNKLIVEISGAPVAGRGPAPGRRARSGTRAGVTGG